MLCKDTISNNMWTSCSRKYYTKWKIKINDRIIYEFNLNNSYEYEINGVKLLSSKELKKYWENDNKCYGIMVSK